ncbi:MAG TPA: HEAT repeat domain-containing protein, partial [Acidimicrobiia bacterium]|nr:HEAT repeat domain-containing protein [Acidimicrobiia bacterium]
MSDNDRATRVALLAGQGCALGLMMAWILIPASTIFLEEYGPERLPVTYIGAACAGILSSSALSAALRRKPLAQVATNILVAMAALLVAAWALLRADAIWVSFALLVLVPIVVPVGFVFIVGQAGALLDVRALKVSYARVVAGFAFGFMLGGLAGPVLLTFLGGTEQLLLAAAVAAGLFLAIVTVARRRYPVELSAVEHDDAAPDTGEPPPTLRTLARYRYVVLIVGFQMLSAIESQWLDFQVFDRAAQRYSDREDLARFVSWYSAIAYGADILFLLVLAGLLLSRFGLRYGLTANSVSVLVVVLAIIVSTILVGSTATLVFFLVVAARVTDLTFSDGSSRTSLSAAYGALPARLRGVAAATVEGLAVPVAIGISGVVLLVLQSAGSTRGLLLPALTAAVVVAWLLTAVLLYREYRTNLLASLRVRALDTEDVTMAAESGRLVIDRLVHSSDERDVRLGLEILEQQQHPELREQLERLIVDERVRVRADALDRLLRLAPDVAATAARDGLADPSADVRAASLRVLGTVRDPSDRTRVAACLDDPDGEVRVAVAFALTRIDSDVASGPIGAAITNLAQSPDPSDRVLAARMIGACDSAGHRPDPGALRALLADPVGDVANAALNALDWSVDVDLRGDVFSHLENRHTVGAAAEALVRMGDPALSFVDQQLRAEGNGDHVRIVLVRVARDIGGPQAAAMLRTHVSDDDRDVGLAVLTALGALGPE